jgi:hypothetical protein
LLDGWTRERTLMQMSEAAERTFTWVIDGGLFQVTAGRKFI